MWKLLTGVFSEKLYKNLVDNKMLSDEQKGSVRVLEVKRINSSSTKLFLEKLKE